MVTQQAASLTRLQAPEADEAENEFQLQYFLQCAFASYSAPLASVSSSVKCGYKLQNTFSEKQMKAR